MKELPDFSKARVLIVGDVMLDHYWHGETARISPEAPVPVVRVGDEQGRPGGAGNVALNIVALGGQATVMGFTGNDDNARKLEQLLQQQQVSCHFHRFDQCPTITKLRVMSRNQQLIRLDFEDGFPASHPDDWLQRYQQLLAEHDVIVLSDYGKGTLNDIQAMIAAAHQAGKPVLIDPKGNDFSKYRGASLITPNRAEFEAIGGRCDSDEQIESSGAEMLQQYELGALLVTRSEKGMTLLERNKPARHMPTLARDVYDVTGAGDTVIAVLAAGLASGMPLEAATQLSNLAAGIVVGKLGTASVSTDELQQALNQQQVLHRGVVSEAELQAAIAMARSRGESIVMTNGCFDILHAGHVTYLEEASRLGDRLVVAVNVDATVRALKGEDRPVNKLEQRMLVLAALACVDWVVPFAEETPERLICEVAPDFLVKGGDNDPDRIPGANCVREKGGQVAVLTYVDGVSTTRIVQSIRDKA
ncbi:MAG: bifunctional D-glycero-beta-D-manno-heptose-7-phosphate kinase/D-glycero-beta-D-manno-heptose 1-phosphate adenylyltransferase HldE [Chromatiales bacterium]|jgi:D-beta-D-heptose 7-phosphate kinase/D-beta-D-heptose 1-phosphate adenosyltransferase